MLRNLQKIFFFVAIRAGAASVQKASTEFGIPTGKLRVKLSRKERFLNDIFMFRDTLWTLQTRRNRIVSIKSNTMVGRCNDGST
jgi:hypothetical protein